ncbi:hypothetical protein KQ304_12610 [Synechococcus sp. CS-1329]|uniref:hypothetical protein n=1 Tax=Synechococcus sp. CS-1329 TaxID=2847975 RepID=UPI00223BDF7E|nr:hypothetical protein [Synechococcus sp. CS-1329]MCT0219821.1 hypothetical protein [Synechococcus sp. CS-1329]
MSLPPTLVLFGANSLCGDDLIGQLPESTAWQCLGRRLPPGVAAERWRHCDLSDLSDVALQAVAAVLPPGPQIWICFAHLWLLAPFLEALMAVQPKALEGLRGVVACSSSSVITKRYAANGFDRDLVLLLATSQEQLLADCRQLGVPARILAPTLIHGRTAHHHDHNVETLRLWLRRLPLLPLPAHTGLRQPIAAADLAAVALDQAQRLTAPDAVSALLPLGGDEELSYRQLLQRLQRGDPRAARCLLLNLPTRLFQVMASPLLLLSPKTFEALQRVSADLAGFPSVAELLDRPRRPFAPAIPTERRR